MATKTFTQLQTQLERLVGDVNAAGTAQYSKWGQEEVKDAINFAIELVRERFLLPTGADLTWVADQYEYSIPGSIAYLIEMKAEAKTGIGNHGPAAGTGIFQYVVPLQILSVIWDGTTQKVQFDKEEVNRHFLNQNDLLIRFHGFKYQDALSADGDVCYINYPTILTIAKAYLHMSAAGRDAGDLLRHLRQLQASLSSLAGFDDQEIEPPGGIWLAHAAN